MLINMQVLEILIKDSQVTGRPNVGRIALPLSRVSAAGMHATWVPLEPVNPGQKPEGWLRLEVGSLELFIALKHPANYFYFLVPVFAPDLSSIFNFCDMFCR